MFSTSLTLSLSCRYLYFKRAIKSTNILLMTVVKSSNKYRVIVYFNAVKRGGCVNLCTEPAERVRQQKLNKTNIFKLIAFPERKSVAADVIAVVTNAVICTEDYLDYRLKFLFGIITSAFLVMYLVDFLNKLSCMCSYYFVLIFFL